MNNNLFQKGFEVELFTGLSTGEHFGVSEAIAKEFDNFVYEPDKRNIEYITKPNADYHKLKEALLSPRKLVREWLAERNLTILPGSTLSLGDSKKFLRSDPTNLYHEFIEKTYGSNIVTTSIHINLGIDHLPSLFAAVRLIRCEASLFLALSASSPFLDGRTTGFHSQRWIQFPLTPKNVPIFNDHNHYVNWVEKKLKSGEMKNERHLWTSVRPNGPKRPYLLNRLEVRICDLITNIDLLLAITTLLELRVISLLKNPDQLDPLINSKFQASELANLSDMNDCSAARNSLDANLINWRDGKSIACREWIMHILESIKPIALEMNMVEQLTPIEKILHEGNQAMNWLEAHQKGKSIKTIMQEGIKNMELEELNSSRAIAIME